MKKIKVPELSTKITKEYILSAPEDLFKVNGFILQKMEKHVGRFEPN